MRTVNLRYKPLTRSQYNVAEGVGKVIRIDIITELSPVSLKVNLGSRRH